MLRTMVACTSLLIAVPTWAATPAQLCQANKNKTAGKYDYCRQKVEAKFALTADSAARTVALQRCLDKYDAKWPLLEAKATAAGGVCPSTGDQATIQGVIDAHTTNVATVLAGGTLPVPTSFPASGQTTCWDSAGSVIPCAGTGQDGDVQAGGTLACTDNGDGTITDNNTGLMWEKLSDDDSIHDKDNTYTWDDAFAVKVATLNSGSFAGHADWRVPNIRELLSLVNYEIGYPGPSLSPTFDTGCTSGCSVTMCSCSGPANHWSSSTIAHAPASAWYVGFDGGFPYGGAKSDPNTVRAVRGGS